LKLVTFMLSIYVCQTIEAMQRVVTPRAEAPNLKAEPL